MFCTIVAAIVAVMGSAQDWSGVDFGRAQFAQVQQFAQERMLDPPVAGTPSEQFAWRHGAELALWNAVPLADLVPAPYVARLQATGWHPQQPPEPLTCDKQPLPELLLVHEPVWNRDPPALKAAWQAWHAAHAFGQRELFCVLKAHELGLPHDDQHQARLAAAWINAASGWLKGLDKHSDVLAAQYWERVSQPDQAAAHADLGFAVTPCAAEQCCIADVREGSSAWRADLRVGDRLETVGFDPCRTPDALTGDAGSTLELRVRSVLRGALRTVRLTRDRAVLHDVVASPLAPGLLHVRLGDFVKGTAARLRVALAAGKKPLRGLVLDMRDNTGGVLDEAVAIADILLSAGVILKARWHDKPDQQPVATDAPDDVRVPVVLLVNRMCASACEVLTGALQDHRRALVLGEHTLGKASMQRVAKPTLMAGFYIKATIGHYWTPNDRDLDGVGALPDVALPLQATTQFAASTEPLWHQAVACVARRGQAPRCWRRTQRRGAVRIRGWRWRGIFWCASRRSSGYFHAGGNAPAAIDSASGRRSLGVSRGRRRSGRAAMSPLWPSATAQWMANSAGIASSARILSAKMPPIAWPTRPSADACSASAIHAAPASKACGPSGLPSGVVVLDSTISSAPALTHHSALYVSKNVRNCANSGRPAWAYRNRHG